MSFDKFDPKYISFLDQLEDSEGAHKTHLNDKVLIVDGLNTFIRAFAVNPAINDDGLHIGGLIGFLKSLRYSIDIIKPTRCIIVFDGKGGSVKRRKLYPEYKNNRKVKSKLNRNVDWGTAPTTEDESMKLQIGRLIEYLEQLPVTLISVDNIEADDAMAYISKQLLVDSKMVLMSTDKDFLQLVDDRINVWSPTKKILYTPEKVKKEFGIPSHNLLIYRVLDGDKSDNINGIKGAGLKSIIKYINPIAEDDIFSAKDLIDYVESPPNKSKLLENIKNNLSIVKRNYLLMQLSDVDISKHIKRKLQESVNREIPQLIKHKLQVMFLHDKLSSQIPNFSNWMVEFIRLSRFKGLSRDK